MVFVSLPYISLVVGARSEQQLPERSAYCVHIHKNMSVLASTAQRRQQGHRVVNKYYRSTCFDEGATDLSINSIPRPLFSRISSQASVDEILFPFSL